METENGATLQYHKTDDGYVACDLYPAFTNTRKMQTEIIHLDFIKKPSKLFKKSKWHWNAFVAYMEYSSLDGQPTFFQKIILFYLNNFKKRVISGIYMKSNAQSTLSMMFKWILSVGFSGFMIFIATIYLNKKKENVIEIDGIGEKGIEIQSAILNELKSINIKIDTLNYKVVLLENNSANTKVKVRKIKTKNKNEKAIKFEPPVPADPNKKIPRNP